MGVFPSTAPSIEVATMNMISIAGHIPKGKEIVGMPSVGPHEALYDAIQSSSDVYYDDHHLVASDPYHLTYWIDSPLPTLDYLSHTFPMDESIMEIMSADEPVWEYHHHRSSFLPNSSSVDFDFVSLISTDIVRNPQTPILLQGTMLGYLDT